MEFRVRDKKGRIFLNKNILLDNKGNIIKIDFDIESGHILTFMDNADIEVNIYTGLKDQKNRKIFEGDIVRMVKSNEEAIGTIILESMGGGIYFKYNGGSLKDYSIRLTKDDYLEIIGNIYDGKWG